MKAGSLAITRLELHKHSSHRVVVVVVIGVVGLRGGVVTGAMKVVLVTIEGIQVRVVMDTTMTAAVVDGTGRYPTFDPSAGQSHTVGPQLLSLRIQNTVELTA